jgi:Tfp pilus assembly protein PilZ
MRIFRARYKSGDDFLRHYQPSFDHGGIFFPTRENLPVGMPVVVEFRFPNMANKMMLRGAIAWRRAGKHRTKLRAGLGIEFLGSEKSKRDYLMAVARGEAQPTTVRRHRRLPVTTQVRWRVKETTAYHTSTLDDIGPGGAFVRTEDLEAAPLDSEVVLEVTPPGAVSPLAIEGRVAWRRNEVDQVGFGIEFRARDAGGVRRLKELVRRLEAAPIDGGAAVDVTGVAVNE